MDGHPHALSLSSISSQSRWKGEQDTDDDCPIHPDAVNRPIEFMTTTDKWTQAQAWYKQRNESCNLFRNPASAQVKVYDQTGRKLLSLPLDFLLMGCVANTSYVLQLVHFGFEQEGSLLVHLTREAIGPQEAITCPNEFVFVRNDAEETMCSPRPGPHFRYPFGLVSNEDAHDLEMVEEIEEAARETPEMARLGQAIFQRDQACLFTDEYVPDVTLIIPIVSPPVDRVVAGSISMDHYTIPDRFPSRFAKESTSPSDYLTISCLYKRLWETGYIALWPCSQGGYIIHVFGCPGSLIGSLHGKFIPRERFTCQNEQLPNPDHLIFHYQQCVIKCVRGYSHGTLPCSETTLRTAMANSRHQLRLGLL